MVVFGLGSISNADLVNRGGGLIYDTDLNVTFLQDANYAGTSGYTTGSFNYNEAETWVNQLGYAGFKDWRFPSAGSNPQQGYYQTGTDLGHIFYSELHIPPGTSSTTPINTGPFINLDHGFYWLDSAIEPYPGGAWYFVFNTGFMHGTGKDSGANAWAVRSGDPGPTVTPNFPYITDPILLGQTFAFEYFWNMGINSPPYQQGNMFDVLALQGGSGWQFIGQIDAYNPSIGWQTAMLNVPKDLQGTETQVRFVLTDYYPETDPTVYLRILAVPEPATMLLLGSGLFGLIGLRRMVRK